jgi:hypothetical protein
MGISLPSLLTATYRAILAEGVGRGLEQGRLTQARSIVLRLGERRFGAPSAETRVAIERIASVERLEALAERVLDVENWQELLTD